MEAPQKTGKTTLLYRQVQMNRDLAILALIIAIAAMIGYSVKGFEFSISSVLQIIGEILGGAIVVGWKLYTPQGKLTKTLSAKANKPQEELDEWGRTIVR